MVSDDSLLPELRLCKEYEHHEIGENYSDDLVESDTKDSD